MLRTENPDVTVPFFMNNPFFDYKKNKDGLKIISFCNWVGYYTGSTSFNEDFIVKNDTIKNYRLMYKYLKVLKNCVLIIDDFFLTLDAPEKYLNPIYRSISVKTISILNELIGFYGNYILVKKKGVSRYSANNMIYIRCTHEIIGGREIEGEFDRTLRENAHRVVGECTELLRAAT